MSLLDGAIGIKQVRADDDPPTPQRETLHFMGARFSVDDDPAANETILTIHASDGTVGTAVSTTLSTNQAVLGATGLDAADLVRISITADVALGGMTAPSGSGDPRKTIALVSSGGGYRLQLTHEDTGSPAANRFVCPFAAPYYLLGDGSIDVLYDATSQRWRVLP